MHFSILTSFPHLYDAFLQTSLIGRAHIAGHLNFSIINYIDMVQAKERIDAPTFGPGPGMLIKPTVIEHAIKKVENVHGTAYRIFFSPQGKKLDQSMLDHIKIKALEKKHVMLVTARYEGFDARVENEYADLVLSIGDYVLMGGELPSMVLMEGLVRLLPGIVGNPSSIEHDSFQGPFVDYPEYAELNIWHDQEVPPILKTGNHKAINEWRRAQQVSMTTVHHFDWIRGYADLTSGEKNLVNAEIPSHYAVLLHDQVTLPDGTTGTSSVTSIDIHDGARSACTYGIKGYFIVTPLVDQQIIVKTLLDFWHGPGKEYNPHRHQALESVRIKSQFMDVLQEIEAIEGKKPLVIATSAKKNEQGKKITYYDQEVVWRQNRPVVLVFGTAQGLAEHFLTEVDYLLLPINGFTDFNHLSVRSAMAIVFDRWLGINPRSQHL